MLLMMSVWLLRMAFSICGEGEGVWRERHAVMPERRGPDAHGVDVARQIGRDRRDVERARQMAWSGVVREAERGVTQQDGEVAQ